MKKGFTMIELIFVIVILGILASVAIPRLASTRADAEISAAIANLRTLLSDASAYYVVKGSFSAKGGTGDDKDNVSDTWATFTNVKLVNSTGASAATSEAGTTAYIKVADVNDCIGVKIVGRGTGADINRPAYIEITPKNGAGGTCKTVVDTTSIKQFTEAKFSYTKKATEGGTETKTDVPQGTGKGAVAIGSNTSVY